MVKRAILVPIVLTVLSLAGLAAGAPPAVKTLPEEEKKLADSADPWGLAFSDQLARFQSHFADGPSSDFVVGLAPTLVKVFPNKYWFRGQVISPEGPPPKVQPLWAVTGSTASFQVAVLPRTGAAAASYTVQAKIEVNLPAAVWREEYVDVGPAQYPRLETRLWPDPLVPANRCDLSGIDAGVFLCEVPVPRDFTGRRLTVSIEVAKADGPKVVFQAPIEVVPLTIQPKAFPLVAWFAQGKLSEEQFRGMCAMALANHLQPFVSGELAKRWKPDDPAAFVDLIEFLLQRGQTVFDLARAPKPEVYNLLKQASSAESVGQLRLG